ncbi:MAG: hypothetical protein BMS9Abin31_0567 [Gammaproteobacteria bacterium]|nr:MAG: hypothetical protein BMS9Abin31_0567 [Gammaproteobacteria bacterium]
MYYIMLDACVMLDISTRKNDLPVVSALEELTSSERIKLVIPDLIIIEYERNKDDVANKTVKRLSHEFKEVKNIVKEFANEQKQQVIDVLNDVSSRLPLLSEANYSTINRVEKLIEDAQKINITDNSKIAAVQRGLDKRAPFHINRNSIADAVIIEQFAEFVRENQSDNNVFIFVTHNHNDFSAKDHRKPHNDFSDIFEAENVLYFNNLPSAIQVIDDDILADITFEYDFTEETRGLREILDAMDELFDKVWYNRHKNLRYDIKAGDIRIVPDDSKEYGNEVIHENVLKIAIQAAERIEEKYDDVGPWDDFEWGMLNGKLSALRWVLGDEWDMLDT